MNALRVSIYGPQPQLYNIIFEYQQ